MDLFQGCGDTIKVLGRQHAFNFVYDHVWKKLKVWKEKMIPSVGHEVLIKSVNQSILTYFIML